MKRHENWKCIDVGRGRRRWHAVLDDHECIIASAKGETDCVHYNKVYCGFTRPKDSPKGTPFNRVKHSPKNHSCEGSKTGCEFVSGVLTSDMVWSHAFRSCGVPDSILAAHAVMAGR